MGLAACAPILHAGSRADTKAAAVGTIAPEFTLIDVNGKKLDLAAYRGKVVLLNFWATWCLPCRSEIPEFVKIQDTYRNRGLRIIGISLDDSAKPVRVFCDQFKINYPVAVGNAALAERYGGILGLPVTFVIRCDGRIAARHNGAATLSRLEQEIRTLLEQKACVRADSATPAPY